MKSSSEIFTEVAGKLGGMANGVEKTNAIMQIFGRSGMELAPLLNRGADGIAKFKEEAQKFGLVLGQDNLDAIQKNVMAHRELHAAVEGMQVQLGQFLYPAITSITKAFSEVVPIIAQMLMPAFKLIGAALDPVVTLIGDGTKAVVELMNNFKIGKGVTDELGGAFNGFKPIIQNVKGALNDLHNFADAFLFPIFKDIAGFMKAQLIEEFKTIAHVVMDDVLPAMQTIWNAISKNLEPVIKSVTETLVAHKEQFMAVLHVIEFVVDIVETLGRKFLAFMGIVIKDIAPVLGAILGVAIKGIGLAINATIDTVGFLIDIFEKLGAVAKIIASTIVSIFSGIVSTIKTVINSIIDMANTAIGALDSIKLHVPGTSIDIGVNIPKIPKLANGGIVSSATIAMIGEAGPEAVVPLSKMGSMGGGLNVTIHVAGSVIQEKDLAITVRDNIAQLMRRRGLDPAILGV
jgi:phage-related protein